MKWLILAGIALSALSGCGLLNGDSDYIQYSESKQIHSQAEATRITNQTNGIITAISTAHPNTETEAALISVIAMMTISDLEPTQLDIIKPTTGYDVLNRHVGTMFSTALTGALGYFSYDTIKEIAGTTNVFNGDVQAEGSFSNSENHITGSDSSSLDTTASDSHAVTTSTDDHSNEATP